MRKRKKGGMGGRGDERGEERPAWLEMGRGSQVPPNWVIQSSSLVGSCKQVNSPTAKLKKH